MTIPSSCDNACDACVSRSPGCTDRMTEERTAEEVDSAPYLIFAGIAIVLFSLLFKLLS